MLERAIYLRDEDHNRHIFVGVFRPPPRTFADAVVKVAYGPIKLNNVRPEPIDRPIQAYSSVREALQEATNYALKHVRDNGYAVVWTSEDIDPWDVHADVLAPPWWYTKPVASNNATSFKKKVVEQLRGLFPFETAGLSDEAVIFRFTDSKGRFTGDAVIDNARRSKKTPAKKRDALRRQGDWDF